MTGKASSRCVSGALNAHTSRAPGAFPARGARIDLATPSGELTPTMRFELQATAAYEEARFEQSWERRQRPDFMGAFAAPGSARYPQQSHAV
jgi:hypothetical protein